MLVVMRTLGSLSLCSNSEGNLEARPSGVRERFVAAVEGVGEGARGFFAASASSFFCCLAALASSSRSSSSSSSKSIILSASLSLSSSSSSPSSFSSSSSSSTFLLLIAFKSTLNPSLSLSSLASAVSQVLLRSIVAGTFFALRASLKAGFLSSVRRLRMRSSRFSFSLARLVLTCCSLRLILLPILKGLRDTIVAVV